MKNILLILLDYGNLTAALPWIATRYFEQHIYEVHPSSTVRGQDYEITTEYVMVTPTVTDPIALKTHTTNGVFYPDFTLVDIELAAGEGDLLTRDSDALSTWYYIQFTYTRPAECTTSVYGADAVITDAARLWDLPSGAENALNPTSSAMTTKSWPEADGSVETTTAVAAYLNPADVPQDLLATLSDRAYPKVYTACSVRSENHEDDQDCQNFEYKGGFGGGQCCIDGCHRTWGLTPVGFALLVISCWAVLLLSLGLPQSAAIFRKMMNGFEARLASPTIWAFVCPPVTLLLLLGRKKVPEKTKDEREALQKQFEAMRWTQKLGLFIRYGFSWKCPPILVPAVPTETIRRCSVGIRDESWAPPPPPYVQSSTPPATYSESAQQQISKATAQIPPPDYEKD